MTPLRYGALTKAMLTYGVHVMGGRVFMVSAAPTEAQIDRTIDAFAHALRALRAEGLVWTAWERRIPLSCGEGQYRPFTFPLPATSYSAGWRLCQSVTPW
jgi:hypothetical protein